MVTISNKVLPYVNILEVAIRFLLLAVDNNPSQNLLEDSKFDNQVYHLIIT